MIITSNVGRPTQRLKPSGRPKGILDKIIYCC
jgi:hypothetical protein